MSNYMAIICFPVPALFNRQLIVINGDPISQWGCGFNGEPYHTWNRDCGCPTNSYTKKVKLTLP